MGHRRARFLEKAIQLCAIEQAAVHDDGADSFCACDVSKWVGIEDDDVGEAATLDL